MCVASVACLPAGLIDGGTHLLEPRSLALGAAVGMLSSAIPYSFEMEALRRIPTHVFGVLMSLEPGMAAFAGFLCQLVGKWLPIGVGRGGGRLGKAHPLHGTEAQLPRPGHFVRPA